MHVKRTTLIHREIYQLGALILVAVAAFLLTRSVAASNRDMTLRDAAEWYQRGQRQVAAHQPDSAIDSFRRAVARNRSEKRYALALANAQALTEDYDAAQAELLMLRESAPEDPDINLQLARLAAVRQDVTASLRFYRNAIYALWPPEQAEARRRIRFELVRFLLARDQPNRAQSELLALATDLPDDVALHLEVGGLFARAADHGRALDQFQRALALAPGNGDALAGAGRAAFAQGNYSLARTFLQRAPLASDEVRQARELTDSILASDPLAAHLGAAERRRRFLADFSYARERLSACPGQDPLLQHEVQTFADSLKPMRTLEQDTVEAGVDLIDRIERRAAPPCGPPAALDRALVLIARQHGVGAR